MKGKDLKITMNGAKETATGMDNWYPADFKMVPEEAFEIMAMIFNVVEEKKEWPQ